MEVHPPEHGIHSWRDFLIHMGTITLGLLIALGLEAAVEAAHHRHELSEARERIHAEIEHNRATIAKDRERLKKNTAEMRANIAILDAAGPLDTTRLHFGWSWDDPDHSAWDTARATGALAYMSYQEAQHYSEVYSQQELVVDAAKEYVRKQVILVTPLMRRGDLDEGTVKADLSPVERQTLGDRTAESLTQIGLIIDLTNGLNQLYDAH